MGMKTLFLRKIFLFLACATTFSSFAHTITVPDRGTEAKVLIHDNGYEMYEYLLAAIDNAEYTVELCPCMTGGEILSTILQHLDQRMEKAPELVGYMLIQPTLIDDNDRKNLQALQKKRADRFFYLFSDCPPYCNIFSPKIGRAHV